MNRQYVVDNDLVARYLRGELADAERTDFEIFYLDDQDTLDEIEALSALADQIGPGASSAADSNSVTEPTDSVHYVTPAGKRAPSARSVGRQWLWPYATAASLVLGVAIGIATGPALEKRIAPELTGATLVSIEATRSSGVPVFVVPIKNRSAVLQVAVGSEESAYRLTLTGADGVAISSEVLTPNAYGDVVLVVRLGNFAHGSYALEATGLDSLGSVLSAEIRFAEEDGGGAGRAQ